MPRGPRTLSDCGMYHVMTRGNEKKNIFYDDEDRVKFLNILAEKKANKEYYLYAYCLMDNHIHLLVKEGTDVISRVMKRVNTTYAGYFNTKYNLVGHVFQDRYKSEVVVDDQYFLTLIRYIHHNPLKAKIIDALSEYKWSSYNTYAKRIEGIIDSEEVLSLFSNRTINSLKAFIDFHKIGDSNTYLDNDEKPVICEDDIKHYISNYTKEHSLKDIHLRNRLVKELRVNYSLSIRRIAELLEIDRGVVQRISVSKEPSP